MSEVRVAFFDPDNGDPRDLGAVSYLIGITGRKVDVAGQVGSGTVKIAIPELAKLTGAYTFIQQHDHCVIWANNGSDQKIGQFIIRSVKLQAGSYGQPSYFTLSGPDMLYYLGKITNHINIGEEFSGTVNASFGMNIGATELRVDTGDIQDANDDSPSPFWPKYSIKKEQTLQEGDETLQLSKTREPAKSAGEQWADGDAIWISRHDGLGAYDEVFKTHIDGTPTVGVDYYEVPLGDPSPVSIKSGDGGAPENYYPMFKPNIFSGDPIQVQMSDTNWHTSIVDRVAYRGLVLETGPTVSVSAGATFYWRDVRTPNTVDDIAHIMENATDWSVPTTASSKGTAIQVSGQKTFDLLEEASKATGDYFYASQASVTAPNKTLEWKTSSPSSGLTFIEPTQLAMQAAVASSSNIIIHSITRVSKDLPITRVVPKGEESEDVNVLWDLSLCDEEPEAGLLRLHGITTNIGMDTEYVNGAWRVRNTSSVIQAEETITYAISPYSESSEDLTEAANRLQAAAALHLHVKQLTERLFDITTVMPDGVNTNPGETVTLTYTNDEWVESKTLYIAEQEYFVQNTGKLKGLRQARFVLSEYGPYPRETGAILVAKAIKSGLGSGGSGSVSVGSGGGGGTPAEPNPVTVDSSTPTNALTAAGNTLTFLATSDGDTNPSTVLYADANGRFRVDGIGVNTPVTGPGIQIDGDIDFIGEQSITTDSGDLNLEPAVDLVINPVTGSTVFAGSTFGAPGIFWMWSDAAEYRMYGNVQIMNYGFVDSKITTDQGVLNLEPATNLIVSSPGNTAKWDDTTNLEGESFSLPGASAFTNQWKIDTAGGAAWFAYLEADQMHIRLFQADVTMAKANGLMVTDSIAVLAADFDVVSVSSTVTITVDDNPALGTAQVFADDDKIVVRAFERSAGLDVFTVGGYVDNYLDNGDGTQDWDFTVEYAGVASGAVGLTVQAGAPIIGHGKSGQGMWEVDARRDIGPFTRISTWAGSDPWTPANRTSHLVTGNLTDITGSKEWGIYAGNSPTTSRFIISDRRAELYDIPVRMFTGTAEGGYIRIHALELNSDIESAVAPSNDISQSGVSRNSGTNDYYTYIDENPASGQPDGGYLYNTDETEGYAWFGLDDISHTLTTLSLEAYVVSSGFTNDTAQVMVQLFRTDGTTPLTDEIRLCSDKTTDGLVTLDFTGVDTSAPDAAWQFARLKVTWLYWVTPDTEVVSLTPEDGLHITSAGTSHGDFSTPAGRYGSVSLGGTTDNPKGWVTLGALGSAPVMTFALKNTDASLTSHLYITNTNSDASDSIALYMAQTEAGSGTNDKLQVLFDGAELVRVTTAGLGVYGGYLFTDSYLQSGANLGVGTYAGIGDGLGVNDGIYVGDSSLHATPAVGQLILDQGAGDGVILKAISSDFDNYSSQGMDSAGTYLQITKAEGSTGGAQIKSGSDGTYSMWVIGSCNTATSAKTTAAVAPLILEGQVDGTSVGTNNNAIVMRSGSITRWIMEGGGDTYQDGDMYDAQNFTPDFLNDVMATRATMLATGKAIVTSYDDDVKYDKDELEALGILKGKYRNRSKISDLHSGSIWELHKRLLDVEHKLGISALE